MAAELIHAQREHGEKPIFQFIVFATDIFLHANEQLEATSVVKRASPPPPRFKNSFR
jgi:hypothetical protein